MLPGYLTTVTRFSKFLALILFILLPILGFSYGRHYQNRINNFKTIFPSPPEGTACTLEAKLCPDGSAVGREPPDCEFAPCPPVNEETQDQNEGQFCGGIAGIMCPERYFCQYDGDYPDASGYCASVDNDK